VNTTIATSGSRAALKVKGLLALLKLKKIEEKIIIIATSGSRAALKLKRFFALLNIYIHVYIYIYTK
jgi:hypothetical protein